MEAQRLVHPDKNGADGYRKRPDHGAESRPAVGIHVVEVVAHRSQPVVLHRPEVERCVEGSGIRDQEAGPHLGPHRLLGQRIAGDRQDAADVAGRSHSGAVVAEQAGHEIFRLDRHPLERSAEHFGHQRIERGETGQVGAIALGDHPALAVIFRQVRFGVTEAVAESQQQRSAGGADAGQAAFQVDSVVVGHEGVVEFDSHSAHAADHPERSRAIAHGQFARVGSQLGRVETDRVSRHHQASVHDRTGNRQQLQGVAVLVGVHRPVAKEAGRDDLAATGADAVLVETRPDQDSVIGNAGVRSDGNGGIDHGSGLKHGRRGQSLYSPPRGCLSRCRSVVHRIRTDGRIHEETRDESDHENQGNRNQRATIVHAAITWSGNWIVAAGMPWVATRDPFDGEPGAAERSVARERLECELRATGMEATRRRQSRRDETLVSTHHQSKGAGQQGGRRVGHRPNLEPSRTIG